MAGVDTKKIVQTKAIARFARFIVKHLYNTNWTLIASASGVIEILNAPEHYRVQRAQGFGDDDYPNAIMGFIQHVFDLNEEVGTLLVNEIAFSENAHDEPLTPEAQKELELILELFGGKNVDIVQFVQKNKPQEDFSTSVFF